MIFRLLNLNIITTKPWFLLTKKKLFQVHAYFVFMTKNFKVKASVAAQVKLKNFTVI